MTTEDPTPERAEDQKRSEKPEMATGDLPPLEAYNAAALAICRYDRHAGLGFSMRDAPNGRQVGEAASAVNAVWNLAYQAGREDAAKAVEAMERVEPLVSDSWWSGYDAAKEQATDAARGIQQPRTPDAGVTQRPKSPPADTSWIEIET